MNKIPEYQDHRQDGLTLNWSPKSFDDFNLIKEFNSDNLEKVGMLVFAKFTKSDSGTAYVDADNDKTAPYTLRLFPGVWYTDIPDGLDIVTITGRMEKFKYNASGTDTRFGCLAYGFMFKGQ